MPRSLRRTRRTAAVLATGLLMAAPAAHASAGFVNLRSPDTRDATAERQAVDLRSPDARELTFTPAPDQPSQSGTDWSDVGIGAGAGFVLLVGLGGAGFALRRRRVVIAG